MEAKMDRQLSNFHRYFFTIMLFGILMVVVYLFRVWGSVASPDSPFASRPLESLDQLLRIDWIPPETSPQDPRDLPVETTTEAIQTRNLLVARSPWYLVSNQENEQDRILLISQVKFSLSGGSSFWETPVMLYHLDYEHNHSYFRDYTDHGDLIWFPRGPWRIHQTHLHLDYPLPISLRSDLAQTRWAGHQPHPSHHLKVALISREQFHEGFLEFYRRDHETRPLGTPRLPPLEQRGLSDDDPGFDLVVGRYWILEVITGDWRHPLKTQIYQLNLLKDGRIAKQELGSYQQPETREVIAEPLWEENGFWSYQAPYLNLFQIENRHVNFRITQSDQDYFYPETDEYGDDYRFQKHTLQYLRLRRYSGFQLHRYLESLSPPPLRD